MASTRRPGRLRRPGQGPTAQATLPRRPERGPGAGPERADEENEPQDNAGSNSGMVNIGLQVDLSSSVMDSKPVRWCLGAASLVIGVALAVLSMDVSLALFGERSFSADYSITDDIGMEGIILFRQHDHNNDGYLSLEEFEPIAHRLVDIGVS